ncbi:MAG: cytochrome c biogenesis protein CcsA [Deltaproteobacteria bacterium]|nr:cytochrome c biogenesis protein CcsA [Deltaproteobacteria bacterium]
MRLKIITVILVLFFAFAQYWGLKIAPPDRMMGDIYRILFVHVPSAWNAMLLFTASFVFSLLYLISKKQKWDFWNEGVTEVGLVLTGLALALGSLWGRPTWGIWWTWDPRLTATAVLFILYAGVLLFRRFLEDPITRAKIGSILSLFVYINVPIVYLSVKWWRSLHQVQSSPQTMAPEMILPLRLNALAILGIALFFVYWRVQLARHRAAREEAESKPPGGSL